MSFFRVVNSLFRFNRTNWKAVSLCFIAATVFWFFNALNKNYSTNVRFPLKFEFDEKKYTALRPLPADVYVNVSGNGWDLLRKYMGLKLPAVLIPLERPLETRKIVGSTLPPLLATQLGNLKVNHIVTDTLFVSIEPKDSLRMKVIINPDALTFKNGYGRTSPIVVLPDSVQVDGPMSLLKGLEHSVQVALPGKKLSENYRQQVEVSIAEHESINRHPAMVEVMFEVGQVTQITQKVKLDVIHSRASVRMAKEMDSVVCVVQIPANRLDDFKQISSGLRAEVDLRDVSEGKKMFPVVRGLPFYASQVSADSIQVKLY